MPGSTSQERTPTLTWLSAWAAPTAPVRVIAAIAAVARSFFIECSSIVGVWIDAAATRRFLYAGTDDNAAPRGGVVLLRAFGASRTSRRGAGCGRGGQAAFALGALAGQLT